MEHGPISFPDWKQALARAGMEPARRDAFEREIIFFLRHCKASHAPVTAALARQYLTRRERQTTGPAREALRWFYREGALKPPGPGATSGRGAHQPPGDVAVPKVGMAEPIRAAPPPASPGGRGPRPLEPPPAASDLGREPWERDLIRASRERNFLWRTEQTYQ